jgi:hypothetical protein
VNWEGIKGTLVEAKRKKVPVIIVDVPVSDPELVLCQVASDNVEAGRLDCEALAKVKPEAKLVILHLSVNKACIDRVAGFKAEMAKHPGMKLLDTQEGKSVAEAARPVMRDCRNSGQCPFFTMPGRYRQDADSTLGSKLLPVSMLHSAFNSNSEAQMTNDERMTKLEARGLRPSWMEEAQDFAQNRTDGGSDSSFGFRASFGIRHSSFGIRV